MNRAPDELHLFRISGENGRTLMEMASVNGMSVERNPITRTTTMAEIQSLQHLESYFDSRPVQRFKGPGFHSSRRGCES